SSRSWVKPRSAGDAEHRPLGTRLRQPEQRTAAFLDDLVGLEDVLRAGMDVAVEALHRRVVQRGATGGAMGERTDVGDHVVEMPEPELDHSHLLERRPLAAIAGLRDAAPGVVGERTRSAVARLRLRELELEAGAVARHAEDVAARNDDLHQLVEN